ncbi:MAG: hypothetical protein J6U58_01375 [Bacteroidaceae bacterium]|nr:hypothetical protein [Bacteroidaceae bacterium]
MEVVLSLVTIGIIYSVVSLVKSLASKNPGVDARPMITEVFPEIKNYEQPPVHNDLPASRKERVAIKPSPQAKPVEKPAEKPVVEEVKCKKFAISGKADAKRAFVYSEIFNRKY